LVPANDPGETGLAYMETFTIPADARARYLSFASMLVCTNDGIAGVDSVWLPYGKKTVYAKAYDVRTEMNTENFANMVPPCQAAIGISSDDEGTGTSDPSISEDGIVIPHQGIVGGKDLIPAVHGWDGAVVKIEIERMK
ncbi:MAG: spondin domain-containing protein, partial [Nitrosopumilaceae archaeon]